MYYLELERGDKILSFKLYYSSVRQKLVHGTHFDQILQCDCTLVLHCSKCFFCKSVDLHVNLHENLQL